jgi:hypothetical protein
MKKPTPAEADAGLLCQSFEGDMQGMLAHAP